MVARRIIQTDRLFESSLANGIQTLQDLTMNMDEGLLRGSTLIRTIIHLTFRPDAPGDQAGESHVDIGIGVVSNRQLTVGSTAVSNPTVETDQPETGWIWRDRFYVSNALAATGNQGGQFHSEVRVDLRGMRRLKDSNIVMPVEMNNDSGTNFTVIMVGIIRMWFKLG